VGRHFSTVGLIALGWAASAVGQDMSIRYAESVAIEAHAGNVEFDAYGKRFSLQLEGNSRLFAKLPVARKAELARHQFLRGSLAGQPGSWVRLSSINGRLEGAIWDGEELYAVSTLAVASPHLATPLVGAPDDTVVYRLSDTTGLLPQNFCAIPGDASAPTNGLAQYKSMALDLETHANAALLISDQLDVALIADSSYQASQSGDVAAAMLARLNTADGIFGAQLALLLNAAEVRLVPQGSDPFTELNPDALLTQVSSYRQANPAVSAAGIAHLVTAKNLSNGVLGIANIAGACSISQGASVSVGTLGDFASGLIMAHEIAHNLGAIHDGTGACASELSIYLMAPGFNNSSRFSQCSVNTMRPFIDASSCVGTTAVADIEASMTAPSSVERQVPFQIVATLFSNGTLTARDATAVFSMPSDLVVDTAVPSSGTCTVSPQPTCDLGDIPANASRTVTLTVRATTEQIQRIVTVTTGATNDRVANNNLAFVAFSVVNSADAAIAVTPGSLTVRKDAPVEYTITLRGLRSQPTRGVRTSGSTAGLRDFTFTPSVGTCTQFGDCNLGDLAPGATATILVRGLANDTGVHAHSLRLDSLDDTNGQNNFATFTLTVDPAYNVGLDQPGSGITLNVGTDGTFEFTARNRLGVNAATNVTVTLFADAFAPLQSATAAGGGGCVIQSSLNRAVCTLGTLAVGESRVITANIRAAIVGNGGLFARIAADRDDSSADNNVGANILVRNPIDLSVSAPYWTERVESRAFVDTVPLYSQSTIAASNFVLTIELADGSRLTSLSLPDTTCEIIDPRHGRCSTPSLAHQPQRMLSVGAVGDSPGLKPVHVAFTATSDANTVDNAVTFDMRIGGYIDAGVTPYLLPENLFLGQAYAFETRLRTSYRDVPNVRFSVVYPVALAVTPPPDLTGCTVQRANDNRSETLNCLMALVPANTDRQLRFEARTVSTTLGQSLWVQALANSDVDWSNNEYQQTVRVLEQSDLSLDLAATTASATAGASFDLPRITLTIPRDSANVLVRVPIPAFASIDRVSSGWICTGTTAIECSSPTVGAGSTTFDIRLRANSAGTFTSRVEASAANDSNAANNVRDIAITVTAAAPPAGSSSGGGSSGGGKGGGGRIEWLGLVLLGLLAAWRARAMRRGQIRSI
jgi:hypothetical protein